MKASVIVLVLLLVGQWLFAQTNGVHLQQITAYQQVVPDPEYDAHPSFGGAVLLDEKLYVNAAYRRMDLSEVRFLTFDVSSPWNVQFLTDQDKYSTLNPRPGGIYYFDNALYLEIGIEGSVNASIRKADLTNPANPGTLMGAGFALNRMDVLTKAGNYLYGGSSRQNQSSFSIWSDGITPAPVQSIHYGPVHGLATDGAYLFLGNDSSGLRILDVSAMPESPVEVALFAMADTAYQLVYDNDLLFLALGASGLVVVDVSDRANPFITGELSGIGNVRRIEKEGSLLITTGADQYLRVVDINNPNAPIEVGRHKLVHDAIDLTVEDNLIAVISDMEISLFKYIPDSGPLLSFHDPEVIQQGNATSPLHQLKALILQNNGVNQLDISGISTSNSSITVDTSSLQIQPGSEAVTTVSWHYLNPVTTPDYLIFENNGPTSPDTLRLYGCPHPAKFYLYPFSPRDFGDVFVGDTITLPLAIEITNDTHVRGGAHLNIHVAGEDSALSASPDTAVAQPYEGRAWFDVTLTPYAAGLFAGNIRVEHSSAHNPVLIEFTANVGNDPTQIEAPSLPELPEIFVLSQNVPNPFNPTTRIEYALPEAGDIRLDVYTIQGQLVRTLYEGLQKAGHHQVLWDGRNATGARVSSGIYLYRIQASQNVVTKKMIMLK